MIVVQRQPLGFKKKLFDLGVALHDGQWNVDNHLITEYNMDNRIPSYRSCDASHLRPLKCLLLPHRCQKRRAEILVLNEDTRKHNTAATWCEEGTDAGMHSM